MKLSNPEIHQLNNQINDIKATLASEAMKMDSMKLYSVDKLNQDLDLLTGRLALHQEAIAVETAEKQKRLDASYKILTDTLKVLKKTADNLDKNWEKLDGSHRGRVADIRNTLRQTLR